MTTEQIITLALGSGVVGAVLKSIVDWWLARGDKKLSREDAIAAANDELAAKLREEMRADNAALRERLRVSEDRIAVLVAQVTQLYEINKGLRDENLSLVRKNAEESYRLGELVRVNADQALKLSTLENDLASAKDRIDVLEAALKAANIDAPKGGRRPGTGPLNPAAAT